MSKAKEIAASRNTEILKCTLALRLVCYFSLIDSVYENVILILSFQ